MNDTYSTSVQVRFRDIDTLNHVSHTVYVVYMQQARLDFSRDVLGLAESEYDTVVAHLEVDYEEEVTVDDEVTIDTWIAEIGSSSFTAAYALTADGTRVATGESVQVLVREETGESTAIPTEWQERLDRYHADGDGPDAE